MSVIILLLIASLSVAGLFLGAFIWGVRNRQFEDGFSPPLRILFDDGTAPAAIGVPGGIVTPEEITAKEVIAAKATNVPPEADAAGKATADSARIVVTNHLNPTKQ